MFFFPGTMQVPLQNSPQADPPSPHSGGSIVLLRNVASSNFLSLSGLCQAAKRAGEVASLGICEGEFSVSFGLWPGLSCKLMSPKIVNATAEVCCSWHWMLHEHLTVKAICFESPLKISRWSIRLQIIFHQSQTRQDIIVWRIETVNRLLLMISFLFLLSRMNKYKIMHLLH